jgi:hypothetical protein
MQSVLQVPDSKRVRLQVRMPAPPPNTANAQQPKRDPAREAIKYSREKRVHEVVASMLTTLHSEALSKEQGVMLERHACLFTIA